MVHKEGGGLKEHLFFERNRAMIRARKNQVNRCFDFGNCPKKQKRSDKPIVPPPEEKQKEEAIKKALIEAAERKKADRILGDVRSQFKGRYSILQILPLLEYRYPSLLKRAIERVEGQKSRNELSIEEDVFFESFKASLEQKK